MEGTRVRRRENRFTVVVLILFLVFMGNALALECPISVNTSSDQLYPDISGDRIVWEGEGNIYLFNITDGNETRLTSGDPAETRPFIRGSQVVWSEVNSYKITLLNLSSQEIRILTTDGNSPALSEDRIAWVNIQDTAAPKISIYDIETATQTDVVTEPYDRPNGGQPAIAGGKLVWVNGTDLTAIYMKTLGPGTVELANESICGNPFDFGGCINNPAISGNRIVWSGFRDDTGNLDIFLIDPRHPNGVPLTENDGFYFNPAIDGDQVVWTDGSNIFLKDSPYEVISSGGSNAGPRISGNRVVWYKDLSGKKDIYLSTIGSSDPCPSVSFFATPRSGVRDLTVQFTDTSITNDTHSHWLWDFGDGTVSFEKNPVHNYIADGSYSVSLTVGNSVGRGYYVSNPDYIRVGTIPVASFSANRTYGIAPLAVQFTDTSSGDPTNWSWDLNGDGTPESNLQNPYYTYLAPGNYTVNLSVTNIYGTGTRNWSDYVRALNGKRLMTSTVIDGLDITIVGGMQQITLDTGKTVSAFNPAENNTWLTLTPPVSSGWERMDFFSMDGIGFQESGGLITGNITSCVLESHDLIPTTFGTEIGNNLPVSFILYLSTYPVNAEIDATIWEGVTPEDDAVFRETIAETSRDFTSITDTAYTLDFVTTNLTGIQSAILNLSVSGAWVQKYGNENNIAVVRLGDDLVNQTLNPTATFTDIGANLDFFSVPSSRGLSRFALVSASGSSNLIQIGARVATQVIQSSQGSGSRGYGSSDPPAVRDSTPWQQPAAVAQPPAAPAVPTFYGEARIDTTVAGITREAVKVSAEDRGAQILIPAGIEAFDVGKTPLTQVSVNSPPPGGVPSGTGPGSSGFTGIAYDLGPDGATFSPPATLTFTIPEASWTDEALYTIRTYDTGTGAWTDIPTQSDPATRTLTGQVSHLCLFGIFAAPLPAAGTPASPDAAVTVSQPAPTVPSLPRTPMGTFTGLLGWVYATAVANPRAGALVLVIAVLLSTVFIARKRRSRITRIQRKR